MKKSKKKSGWKWYAIKLLFESTISGEPDINKIDKSFSNEFKLFEEQIVVIKAQSSDHAYKKADIQAKKSEMTYYNPYGQLVHYRFVNSINCQQLFDNEIKSGTEIYSRLFKVPINEKMEKIIATYLPETVQNEEKATPFYNFLINE